MKKQDILNAIQNGITVYWSNLLYIIKLDFDNDLIIKCTTSVGQCLLEDGELQNCFTI